MQDWHVARRGSPGQSGWCTAQTLLSKQALQCMLYYAAGLARSQAWQPWSDWLVYCAAAALPWGGSEMSAACPTEFGRLMESVEAYLVRTREWFCRISE